MDEARKKILIDKLDKLEALARGASTGPWMAASGPGAFDNWLMASMGEDEENVAWYVTTDHVRASELMSGGPEHDARFIAEMRNSIGVLLRLARRALEAGDGT